MCPKFGYCSRCRPLAPLASRFVICNLKQDFKDLHGWSHLIKTWALFFNQFCNPSSKELRIASGGRAFRFIYFIRLGHHFGRIWESWGTTLAPLWRSLGARVHSGGPFNALTKIFNDFWWFLGGLLIPLWGHFCIISAICGIKKHVWIAGTHLDVFWLETCQISDVPTSQKCNKNWCFC